MEIKIISPKYGEHIVLIDEEDYELISKYRWHINYHNDNVYATHVFKKNGKSITYKMHRLILGFPKAHIDHKDGNGLNNKKENLRLCTISENQQNKKISNHNSTGFKGVTLHKRERVYQAAVCLRGKYYYSFGYRTAIEAAAKYNEMAIEHHGEFAKLNEINKDELAIAQSIKRKKKIPIHPLGKTGIRGVHINYSKEYPFKAAMRVGKKIVLIGKFKTKDEASFAYTEYKRNLINKK